MTEQETAAEHATRRQRRRARARRQRQRLALYGGIALTVITASLIIALTG